MAPSYPTKDTVDDVAAVVGHAVAAHGLTESWQVDRAAGAPCTMARGCIWSPGSTPWLTPWVSVTGTADGAVQVRVEDRYVWDSLPVRNITDAVANALRQRFGSGRVSIRH